MTVWNPIWHQAVTQSFLSGKAFGKNKTVIFTVHSPLAGTKLRVRFRNSFGTAPYEIGRMNASVNGVRIPVTVNGLESFRIPAGGITMSDELELNIPAGSDIEFRLYYTSDIIDCNMIEEHASLLKGNQLHADTITMQKPLLAKILGAYNAIPSLDLIEVYSDKPSKSIVAFGDSITALSQWTKPLAKRLENTYGDQYTLLNSGISGNCLLYEPEGIFGPVFGQKGTARFRRDVLDIPNLHGVIFGLGVNDVSYLNETTAAAINPEQFRKAVTDIVNESHARNVRVTMQTISPRLGVAITMGKYNRDMEDLRLKLNDWIRSAGIFDYVFDAEAVVREERPDGYYYGEGLHQGDHLHPNAKGGQMLADAYDLSKLTGEAE